MKVAYVAGPYRAPTPYQTLRNIREAEYAALKLWKMGYAVICPHKNTALFDGECDDSTWLEGYLEILKRCDLIVPLPNWPESEGSQVEILYALKHNIPMYDLAELVER